MKQTNRLLIDPKPVTSLEQVDDPKQIVQLVHLKEDAVHEVQEVNYGFVILYFCGSCKKFVDDKIYVKKD